MQRLGLSCAARASRPAAARRLAPTLGVVKHFLCIFALLVAASACAQVRLEPLSDDQVERGCGCSFHVPFQAGHAGSMVLQWSYPGPAKIKVQGNVYELTVASEVSSTPAERRERVGDSLTYELRGPSVAVSVKCRATWVCPSNDESCEVSYYRAQILLTLGKTKSKVTAWGACGC